MSQLKKRKYNSEGRQAQAALTRQRILEVSRTLFKSGGFECTTIEKIAKHAKISSPTVYTMFLSKRGILRALLDEALPSAHFENLLKEVYSEKYPKKRLQISAKIARQLYDAEREQMEFLQGASVIAPEFREIENERERRRYDRQAKTIKLMVEEKSLAPGLSESKARDILWALTGRDIYRMLVCEQSWTSDEYEGWVSQLLIQDLIRKSPL